MKASLPAFPIPIGTLRLGRIVLDQKSERELTSEDVIFALSRHIRGDWGKISQRRKRLNMLGLRKQRPLHSVFFSTDGTKFTVLTNGKRTITKVCVTNR